jgi:hypothetical protein
MYDDQALLSWYWGMMILNNTRVTTEASLAALSGPPKGNSWALDISDLKCALLCSFGGSLPNVLD